MNLQKLIERHWYVKQDPFLIALLFPMSLIYDIINSIRRILFMLRILHVNKINV